jgi:prepilin-type N-terminal cleavage/methylation domain-containing protein
MKRQEGFSLPELLVTVAITGLIVSFLGMAVYQILNVTEYGSDKMTATHELQNAAHWVSYDGQMAKTASGGDELVLILPDSSQVTYGIAGSELLRTSEESQMTLARNITAVQFLVEERTEHITAGPYYEDREERTITMSVTSAPEGRPNVSEQREYKICLRPTEPSSGIWRME